jgi:hypothetical protein
MHLRKPTRISTTHNSVTKVQDANTSARKENERSWSEISWRVDDWWVGEGDRLRDVKGDDEFIVAFSEERYFVCEFAREPRFPM